jgi:histidinol phosphatase-like PHP family hydrolase
MKTARVNLHAHEAQHSFDSHTSVEEMARAYRAAGFDAVGFVGHGEYTTVDAPGLVTINGVEHGVGPGVHLVAYPQHDFYIAAHPRYSALPKRAVREFVDIYQPDAVEKFNSGVDQYTGRMDVIEVAGDDAHNPDQVATSYMDVRVESMTEDAIMDAIKRGDYDLVTEGVSVKGYVRKAVDVVMPGD